MILPFVWIFNPQLLLIDVHGWWELTVVVVARTVACLHLRRGDDGLVPDEEPLVGDGAAARRGLHALPAQLLHGPASTTRRRTRRPRRSTRSRKALAGGLPAGARDRGHQRRGRGREEDGLGAAHQAGRGPRAARRSRPHLHRARRRGADRHRQVRQPRQASRVRAGLEGELAQGSDRRVSEYWVYIPALALVALVFFLQRARMRRTGRATA